MFRVPLVRRTIKMAIAKRLQNSEERERDTSSYPLEWHWVRFVSVRLGSVRYGTVRYGTVRYGYMAIEICYC